MNRKNQKQNIGWQGFFALAMLGMLAFFLLYLIVPLRGQDLYNVYGVFVIAAMAGVYFVKKGLSGPLELKVFAAYTVWVLVSRWLNGDIYLFVDFDYVMFTLLAFLMLAAGTVLDKKQREVFMDVLTFIYAGFFLLTAIASLFVFITKTYIHIPPENVWITIKTEGALNSINALSEPRCMSAGRFALALCLLLYQFLKRKKPVARILLAVAMLILHLASALCHGRTTQISMSVGFAMLMLLVFIPVFRERSKVLRFTALPVIAAVSLLLFYKSYDVSNLLLDKAQSFTAPRFEAYYDALENKPNEENFGVQLTQEELALLNSEDQVESEETQTPAAASTETVKKTVEASAVDSRSIIGNWTFTGRTEIWQSGLIAIKEDPSIALRGHLNKNLMETINRILTTQVNPSVKEYKNHMHNSFMQVLMRSGIPGLILILVWTVLMVKNMVKLFFSRKERDTLAAKSLTILMANVFIFSLAEVPMFSALDNIGMVFFLASGAFLSFYYDSFPRKKAD